MDWRNNIIYIVVIIQLHTEFSADRVKMRSDLKTKFQEELDTTKYRPLCFVFIVFFVKIIMTI
jgi:hypothetical protein